MHLHVDMSVKLAELESFLNQTAHPQTRLSVCVMLLTAQVLLMCQAIHDLKNARSQQARFVLLRSALEAVVRLIYVVEKGDVAGFALELDDNRQRWKHSTSESRRQIGQDSEAKHAESQATARWLESQIPESKKLAEKFSGVYKILDDINDSIAQDVKSRFNELYNFFSAVSHGQHSAMRLIHGHYLDIHLLKPTPFSFENDIDGYVLEFIDLTQVAVKNYVLGSQSTTGVLAPKYPI